LRTSGGASRLDELGEDRSKEHDRLWVHDAYYDTIGEQGTALCRDSGVLDRGSIRTVVPDGLDSEPHQIDGAEQFHRGEHSYGTLDDNSEPRSNESNLEVDTESVAGNGDKSGLAPEGNRTADDEHHTRPRYQHKEKGKPSEGD
jgi:hypothetical protein